MGRGSSRVKRTVVPEFIAVGARKKEGEGAAMCL